jgi:hypothetical protein
MRHAVAIYEWDLWQKREETDLQEMADSLGIAGVSEMSKGMLIESIRRLDADLLYHGLGPT